MLAATATVSNVGTPDEISLLSRVHSHDLPCTEELDQIVIRTLKIQDQCRTLLYFYPFLTSKDVVEALSDL